MSYGQKQSNIPDYFVVRFNHKLLKYDIIDNKNIRSCQLKDILTNQGLEILADASVDEFHLRDLKIEKLFPHYLTSDSISISRFGTLVNTPPFWATFKVFTPKNIRPDKYLKTLIDQKCIVYVDSPTEIEYDIIPDDSLFFLQHSINSIIPEASINAEQAWDIETGRKFIKVGVHDSGIDTTHPDIDVLVGKAFFQDGINPWQSHGVDIFGHGTSTAGIIGAKSNNGIGIAGIAGGTIDDDESGVSLIDMKLGEYLVNGEYAAIAMIDGARSVGSYWDWTLDAPTTNYNDWVNAVGFGLNLANHSYHINATSPVVNIPGKDVPGDNDSIVDFQAYFQGSCLLCREAFLFSLQNGVTNVFSRGNHVLQHIQQGKPLTYPDDKIPTNSYDDSWYLSIGASGMDGNVLNSLVNGGLNEVQWKSPIGKKLDLIAPGSSGLNITTRSSQQLPAVNSLYRRFNGTSSSAPYATGVAALLMSKYNKPCYSNTNLDPADIEYILQKSANHIALTPGYDDTTGWGRLDAKKALDMIDFPLYQIIHPPEQAIQQEIVAIDTIPIWLGAPLYNYIGGPLGSNFPLVINENYRVERIKMRFVYDFSNYMTPSSQLLDVWIRHSQTNSLSMLHDTIGSLQPLGNTGSMQWIVEPDTFDIAPKASIIQYDQQTVEFTGYYYHFIKQYDGDIEPNIFLADLIDFWYPINPHIHEPNVAYSLYIKDEEAIERFDFPCDSLNILVDPNMSTLEINALDFSLYPNPSTGELKIRLESNLSGGELSINDNKGRLISAQTVETYKKQYKFQLSHLTSGVYFVHFINDKGESLVKKWIKL